MALLTCEDCGGKVSDAAVACPQCGRPVAAMARPSVQAGEVSEGGMVPAPAPRPWVRFWARMVDGSIATATAYLILLIDPGFLARNILRYGGWVVGLALWVLIEAMLLSSKGTTPGRSLLRITVMTEDGTRPTFDQALARSWRVWLFGMGAGIPIVSAVTMIVGYVRLKKEYVTTWDLSSGLRVTHEPIGAGRIIAAIAVALFVAMLAAVFRQMAGL